MTLVAATLVAMGCDDGTVPGEDAGGVDAATVDGGDAGERPDGAPGDGGSDDGGPPDAGPPEPCDSPGAIETVACGMCGTVERFCTSEAVWAYGTCEDEGLCAPGSLDSTSCGDCGTQSRICNATCEWEDMGVCSDEGECTPGAISRNGTGCPAGQQRDLLCNDACTFAPSSECTADGCPTAGVTEDIACGTMCGTRERFCTSDNVWEYGLCEGEGVCVPGTTSTASCGMCGTQTTRCTAACAYMTSGSCTGEGVCAPGTTQRTTDGCTGGETRLVECGVTCGYTIEVEPCAATVPIDVLFLPDATPSNWGEFQAERSTFISRCVDPLLAIDDVTVGIAYYGDLGTSPEAFQAGVELGRATSAAISADILSQSYMGGGEDSTLEALHILSGGTPHASAVPFVCSSGRVAGGCWRPGAQRVIVMHTDESARSGPDPYSDALHRTWGSGADWLGVRPALMSDATMLFVMIDDDGFEAALEQAQYEEMVGDLGQPPTDVYATASVGAPCDAIVARVRALTGM